MTDLEAWMEERRSIHAKAALKAKCESHRGMVSTVWSGAAPDGEPLDDRESVAESWPEGGEAIADALNSLPQALDVIDAVLAKHRPASEVPGVCEECSKLMEDVPLFVPYPCPTVSVMKAVIAGETEAEA